MLSSTELRTTEFAPALEVQSVPTDEPEPAEAPAASGHLWTSEIRSFFVYKRFSWFRLSSAARRHTALSCQPSPLSSRAGPERNGSLRVLYAARIGHCHTCPLRALCQESSTTIKPRRVSAVYWPLEPSPPDLSSAHSDAPGVPPRAPVLWKDWPRCALRRRWLKVIRSETVSVTESFTTPLRSSTTRSSEAVLTRAERAHWRLSWEQRLARNARPSDAPRLFITLHGLPATFVSSFGFDLLATT